MEREIFSTHMLPLALSVIGGLIALLAAIGGFCFKRLFEKLDALIVHKEGCITQFANRERNVREHEELFGFVHEHDKRLGLLEDRVDRIVGK